MSDPRSATQRWERRIEAALDPVRYVPEPVCLGFVADLEDVVPGPRQRALDTARPRLIHG